MVVDSICRKIDQRINRKFVARLCNSIKLCHTLFFVSNKKDVFEYFNITFITFIYFTHTSFEVVQALITLQHNTLHFFCLFRRPTSRRNNLTDSMLTEQLPDLLDYISNQQRLVCLVGYINIHFDIQLQSLTM